MTRWYPVITPVAVTITMERTILITVYGSYVVLFQHQARSTHVQHRACLASAALQPLSGNVRWYFSSPIPAQPGHQCLDTFS